MNTEKNKMNTISGIKNHDNGFDSSFGLGNSDLDNCLIAGFSDEDFGNISLDDLGSPSIQSADLGRSHFDDSAQGFDHELTDAETAIIRLVERKIGSTRARAAAAKSEKVYITHEDFDEGPERDAFLLIYGYAEHLFDTTGKEPFNLLDRKKLKALRFFFCRSSSEIHLQDAVACIDNHIRTDVLRLRFMLEFWLRGWVLPPLPGDADILPDRIELMAAQYEGMLGIALAREAWFEPGIEAGDLLSRILDDRGADVKAQIAMAFKDLVMNYVLSISNGKVYTTGKNPILELEDKINDPTVRVRGQLANIYWSRRF